MSKLKIADEGMIALWDGLALELEHLAAPRGLPHGFLQMACSRFLSEGVDGCHDIFECVAVPARGAEKSVLRLRISRAFDLYLTRAAKDALGIVCH